MAETYHPFGLARGQMPDQFQPTPAGRVNACLAGGADTIVFSPHQNGVVKGILNEKMISFDKWAAPFSFKRCLPWSIVRLGQRVVENTKPQR